MFCARKGSGPWRRRNRRKKPERSACWVGPITDTTTNKLRAADLRGREGSEADAANTPDVLVNLVRALGFPPYLLVLLFPGLISSGWRRPHSPIPDATARVSPLETPLVLWTGQRRGSIVFWCGGVCPWIRIRHGCSRRHGAMGRMGGTFILFPNAPAREFAWRCFCWPVFLMPRWWAIPLVAALWTGIERTRGFFGFAWLGSGQRRESCTVAVRLTYPITGVCRLYLRCSQLRTGAAVWSANLGASCWRLVARINAGRAHEPRRLQRQGAGGRLVQPEYRHRGDLDRRQRARHRQKLARSRGPRARTSLCGRRGPGPVLCADGQFRDYAGGIARTAATPRSSSGQWELRRSVRPSTPPCGWTPPAKSPTATTRSTWCRSVSSFRPCSAG